MKPSHILWLVAVRTALSSLSTNDTLLWGPYRPNLYFGLRPQLPESLMTGFMWFGTQDYQSISNTRHVCDQGDKLDTYTWQEYDPREGGVQVIKDSSNNVKITTEFLKIAGGSHGGSWAARIKGEPMVPDIPSRISTIFYFTMEGLGGLELDTDENEDGIEGDIKLIGSTPALGDFDIRIVEGPNNSATVKGFHYEDFKNRVGKTHFLGQKLPVGHVWRAKDFIIKSLVDRAREKIPVYQDSVDGYPDPSFVLQLPDEMYSGSNLFAFQKSFDGSFQFDVYYESGSVKQNLSSSTLDQGIPALVTAFNQRFEFLFPYPSDYPVEKQAALQSFSKAITSNLVGGVGYFYGNSMVNRKFFYEWDEDDEHGGKEDSGIGLYFTDPKSLLTATPSRSFFPRGFYWDEGFHLLHISLWDNDFSLRILNDWIGLIDEDGWVAREQILGEEARSKVPVEFQTQIPNYANPPTLTIAVVAFVRRLKESSAGLSAQDLGMDFTAQTQLSISSPVQGFLHLQNPELSRSYLQNIYKPLKRHYDWFRRTQIGQIKQYGRFARSRTEAYRWRGRSELHVLTSGMDDYPRGPPHVGELHIDLISWMAFFTRTMKEISEYIGQKEDVLYFDQIETAILNNLDDLHWNEEQKMYCDLSVDDNDESYHVCHKGYLSIVPFLLSLLPPSSPKLENIFDLLQDPNHLWSQYGLRSLSASHSEFGQGENYWKGPIWIQMNYLALNALHETYMAHPGPYQKRAAGIYKLLRKNVVDNVFKEYERTGYVWEQYDAVTGEGKRSHPFTGWTSLVSLILAEKYFL